MSFVAINTLTVPPEMRDTLEERFASRAGDVEQTPGFEEFELLRPLEGQDRYLVYTRWESEEAFKEWMSSSAFSSGHAQHQGDGPAATDSALWTFHVAERKAKE